MDSKGDVIDQGNETAEIFRKAALSQRKPEGPEATGFCFNCEARLRAGLRWCDVACRDDWQKTERAAAMAPREPDPVA